MRKLDIGAVISGLARPAGAFVAIGALLSLLAFVFLVAVFGVNRYSHPAGSDPTLLSSGLSGMLLTARDIMIAIMWAGMLSFAYAQLVPQVDLTAEVFA